MTNDKYCPYITYDSPVAWDSLYHLHTTGAKFSANYVSIIVTQYQWMHNTTDIFPIYHEAVPCGLTHLCITATEEALTSIINNAHQLNMSVMLKPQIDLVNDITHWRGEINFKHDIIKWDRWFQSYLTFISLYASLSQRLGVELLSVSCELINATTCLYCQQKWKDLIIPSIRSIYKGELTVSANWADPKTNMGEITHINWWNEVDYIGCDQYYVKNVSGNGINGIYPTMDELLQEWSLVEQQMMYLHKKWKMEIIFTEIGYCSGVLSGSNDSCWCNGQQSLRPSLPSNESLYAQYNQYEAALISMTKYDWFKGYFWWNWPTDAAFNGYNGSNSCMTPSYKPTETLLRKWYNATLSPPAPPTYAAQCVCWE
eukprot:1117939_1